MFSLGALIYTAWVQHQPRDHRSHPLSKINRIRSLRMSAPKVVASFVPTTPPCGVTKNWEISLRPTFPFVSNAGSALRPRERSRRQGRSCLRSLSQIAGIDLQDLSQLPPRESC